MKNMITIENKETSIATESGENLKYSDLLGIVLNTNIPQGITVKQMKDELATFTKTEGVPLGDVMCFTEEEVVKIKALSENHLWAARHKDLIAFGDYLESL